MPMMTLHPKEIPYQIQQQFDWLRELYPWQLLMGEMIHLCESTFKDFDGPRKCEFARDWSKQDPELAKYQWFATIQRLYSIEYTKTLTGGVI